LERPRGPLLIVDASRDAVGVPEVEFGKVAVKVLLAAVLIAHASLEDAERAFDDVG